MLTTRAAARLLADADGLPGLAALAGVLGFPTLLPLDQPQGAAVGLDAGASAAVAVGPGPLRALLIAHGTAEPLRDLLSRVSRRLAARAPHQLWLVLAGSAAERRVVIATWSGGRTPPRIHALTVQRDHVVDSDATTLRALHAAAAASRPASVGALADTIHAAWLDLLGRDALTRRFYRELAGTVHDLAAALVVPAGRVSTADRSAFALLQLSRLLFLGFVEAKGWLDGDPAFLANAFARCMASGGSFHRRVLRPLVFGTLNTPPRNRARAAREFGRVPFLNGGLFARTPLERRLGDARWDDQAIGWIFERLLGRYRFTAREDQQRWSDAAVDPEMLGRAFESLMQAGARRDTGAYYTPPALVTRVTHSAIATALACATVSAADISALLNGAAPKQEHAVTLRRRLRSLRLLDPACGSGAFLVHALETLATLHQSAGDTRATSVIRRELLASTVFGVDVNPMAVWLCELRLWLSAIIEHDEPDPFRVPPLPNLDHYVRVGDSLAGGDLGPAALLSHTDARALAQLRGRYARAAGAGKRTLGRLLERRERTAAIADADRRILVLVARRRDLLASLRAPDLFGQRAPASPPMRRCLAELRDELRRLRARRRALAGGAALPFAFATHFADVVAGGGFGLVIGNPPWVRPHRLAPAERVRLRGAFTVASGAAWTRGAELAGAGAGFAAQADLSALFVERSLALLRPGGTVALLVPSKLWRALAGGGVRRLLAERAELVAVEDWSRSRHCFDAAVYPSLVIARRIIDNTVGEQPGHGKPDSLVRPCEGAIDGTCANPWFGEADDEARTTGPAGAPPVRVAERIGDTELAWSAPARALSFDGDPAAPWVLLPPDARRVFQRLRGCGTPLALAAAGRPMLGVKSGCNAAFLFRLDEHGASRPWQVGSSALRARAAAVEPELLRPLVRGETLTQWRLAPSRERMLWTHDTTGAPSAALPPGAVAWLAHWRARLERRADARAGRCWWPLYRTEAARHDRPRVLWADFGRRARAAFVPAGHDVVPLNSCYALRCHDDDDALAITALLAAPVITAWLAALAEPARGGYRRHLGWTLSLLPLPHDWAQVRAPLAELARHGYEGRPVDDDALTHAACAAYMLTPRSVRPLLDWASA